MTEAETKVHKTEGQLIEDMYDQFIQIEKYMTIVKELKTSAKDAGFDGALLAKVAKAKADDKVNELTEKTEALLALLNDEGDE